MVWPVLVALLWAAPALSQGEDEPHLPILALDPALTAWRATVLASADDRTQPQPDLPEGYAPDDPLPGHSDRIRQGEALFGKPWLAAPSSLPGSDGLGPLYNARSCLDCHSGDPGRVADNGRTPGAGRSGAVLRLSVPGGTPPMQIEGWLATVPDPVYGQQVQDLAAPGQRAEARLDLDHVDQTLVLSGGDTVRLRRPEVTLRDLAYGPPDAGVMTSLRVPPSLRGLGLLEAIPAGELLARADPSDADGDGISGRAQIVPSAAFARPMLGRFGWKAGMPTLQDQTAAAFAIDMGLSSPDHPAPWGDCTAAQAACRDADHGADDGADDGADFRGQFTGQIGGPRATGRWTAPALTG